MRMGMRAHGECQWGDALPRAWTTTATPTASHSHMHGHGHGNPHRNGPRGHGPGQWHCHDHSNGHSNGHGHWHGHDHSNSHSDGHGHWHGHSHSHGPHIRVNCDRMRVFRVPSISRALGCSMPKAWPHRAEVPRCTRARDDDLKSRPAWCTEIGT